jgi:hypothetical protein
MALLVDSSGYAYDPSTGYESDTAASGFDASVPGTDPISAGSQAGGSGIFSAIGSALSSVAPIIKAVNQPSPNALQGYARAGYIYNPQTGTYTPTTNTVIGGNTGLLLIVGLGVVALFFLSKKA